MELFIPEYYEKFCCLASACPDSCCHQWTVDVDAEAAERYRSLSGALGDRLRQVLEDTENGTQMRIENDRCPMWRQDGLCQIQLELGHDALCKTCREFPRLRHDYGDFAELGLELSCPEAARLILTEDWDDVAARQVDGGEAPDYDTETMKILRESRRKILAFLQDDSCCAADALQVLLLYGYEVQSWLDGGEPVTLDPAACLAAAQKHAQPGELQAIFDFFKTLEILTPQWKAKLAAGPMEQPLHPYTRALIRYGIYRYWYQAVSDYDLVCRVKFIVIYCLMVNALEGDFIQNAQLFSKEIENDPDNVEALLDGAYTHPALTDAKLLWLSREMQ